MSATDFNHYVFHGPRQLDPPPHERIESYLGLIRHAAKRFAANDRIASVDDLVSVAVLDLLQRWDKYDPLLSSRRVWVYKFARWAVSNAIRANRDAVRGVPLGGRIACKLPEDETDPAQWCDDAADENDDFLSTLREAVGRDMTDREEAIAVAHFVDATPQSVLADRYGVSRQRINQILTKIVDDCKANAGVIE